MAAHQHQLPVARSPPDCRLVNEYEWGAQNVSFPHQGTISEPAAAFLRIRLFDAETAPPSAVVVTKACCCPTATLAQLASSLGVYGWWHQRRVLAQGPLKREVTCREQRRIRLFKIPSCANNLSEGPRLDWLIYLRLVLPGNLGRRVEGRPTPDPKVFGLSKEKPGIHFFPVG